MRIFLGSLTAAACLMIGSSDVSWAQDDPAVTAGDLATGNAGSADSFDSTGDGPGDGDGSAPYEPRVEWEKRQDAERRMQAHGHDLLGDSIDPATGAISFETTDVSIPGNSALPVAVTRKREQGNFFMEAWEFGSWRLTSVPRIYVEVPDVVGEQDAWTTNRCSHNTTATLPSVWWSGNQPAGTRPQEIERSSYSNGVRMDIPGEGSKPLLWSTGQGQFRSGTRWTTVDN